MTKKSLFTVLIAFICIIAPLLAVPPYGDPNQPYDRLPGTWETWHVKWLKPSAHKKLKVLCIIPYANSREIVELGQRLDIETTVIMNAGRSSWAKGGGGGGGPEPTPLMGAEAEAVLEKISRERLALTNKYDVIVIATISWEVIPKKYHNLILKHVEDGAGLVYVSPNRLNPAKSVGEYATEVGIASNKNAQYTKLFTAGDKLNAAAIITQALPMDIVPLVRVASADEAVKMGKPKKFFARLNSQSPMRLTTAQHGKGRVICLQYFGIKPGFDVDNPYSLTPVIPYDKTMYDYYHALLARCVRWSSGYVPELEIKLSVSAPVTELRETQSEESKKYDIVFKTPKTVVDRKDIAQSKIVIEITNLTEKTRNLEYELKIRDLVGGELLSKLGKIKLKKSENGKEEIPLPNLGRGNYLIDLRVLKDKKVVDFVSKSMRVESALRVVSVSTEKDRYLAGDTIKGTVVFSSVLAAGQRAEIRISDTWKRTVSITPVEIAEGASEAEFSVVARKPVSQLWDIDCFIVDKEGDVASAGTWVGMPDYNFDNFITNMTFTEGPPEGTWKGIMFANRAREFGVNSHLDHILHMPKNPGRMQALSNMSSLFYADHLGPVYNKKGRNYEVEFSGSCMSELSKMCRYTAETGKLMSSKEFPYKFNCGVYDLTADSFGERFRKIIKPSGKFGTPFYIVTGENHLHGEMDARENSCFCKLCANKFQTWCKKEFNGNLKALNAEWNSKIKSWDAVRGIMMMEAVNKDQLPRWVDFRYFMRSKVWTQFFVDYTEAIRRFVPNARTGRIGHQHYDFSLFRNRMSSTKIYQEQTANPELHTMVEPELLTSFSHDNSIIIGSCGLINWYQQYVGQLRRQRWPWKMFYMGFRGYDMERNLTSSRLGGESWLTPCMSDRMPFFADMSDEVLILQRGICNLTANAKPLRSKIAILWDPRNHFISRLDPFQDSAFSGGHLYNIEVEKGAHHDCLALLKSIRIRGKYVAPEDIVGGVLQKENYKALFLPFSKGISMAEVKKIQAFVKGGGVLFADNTPGIYTQHGRKLKKSRLSKLFPVMDKRNVMKFGKGHTIYLHNDMNGYVARMEKGDYTGSDGVALALKQYAGITTPVELIHDNNTPRRDTLMPVWKKGSATYFGLLRHEHSAEEASTKMVLDKEYHVWEARKHTYLGHVRELSFDFDKQPRFMALYPANPKEIRLYTSKSKLAAGNDLIVKGKIVFESEHKGIRKMGQVVHIRVYDKNKKELEWFRKNIVFEGKQFELLLPLSASIKPGAYSVQAEHSITGIIGKARFRVQ